MAMVKVDPFQAGYNEGRHDEEGDWIIEGHGQHCGFQPTAVREDSAIQTDDPPPRSIATTAIQTDTPKPQLTIPPAFRTTNIPDIIPFVIQNTSSQMSPHPEPTPNPTHITSPPSPPLNWADDAASLPILSLPILSSCSAPRDLSVLRSLTPKPFSSLQHRNKRSQAHHSQHFRNPRSFPLSRQTFPHRRFPPPRFFSTPFRSAQVYPRRTPRFPSPSALNWDGDPRLFELSQALNALGWVRQ